MALDRPVPDRARRLDHLSLSHFQIEGRHVPTCLPFSSRARVEVRQRLILPAFCIHLRMSGISLVKLTTNSSRAPQNPLRPQSTRRSVGKIVTGLSDGFMCLGPRLDARDSHLTPGAGVAVDGKAKLGVVFDHGLNLSDCIIGIKFV